MKLTFLGAAETVTGSCYLLEAADTKVMIDCGMFQGSSELSKLNEEPFDLDVKSLKYLILTHAHMDHSGRIPKLVKDGFTGKVFCTKASRDLCEIMLEDSAHIQEMEAEYDTRKNRRKGMSEVEPLYTMQNATDSMKYFSPVRYNDTIKLNETISFCIRDAGHMLGSGILELWVNEKGESKKIVFSGDLGNLDQPLLKDPTVIDQTDYLVMESTYGNRNHEHKDKRSDKFLKIIMETAEKGGTLVIPSFAIGRTQEILYDLNYYKENQMLGKFNDIKVILDSPLAIKATEIFKKYYYMLDHDTQELVDKGDDPLVFENLVYSLTADESKAINFDKSVKIIISASGMCEAGRIRHHLKHNIFKENCTVLFVGYQAEGSLGRLILDGAKNIKLFGERIAVKARIESLDYYSGHADHDGLINWVNAFTKKPEKIILTHGETDSIATLRHDLNQIGYSVEVGKFKSTYDFSAVSYTAEASAKIPSKETAVQTISQKAEHVLSLIKNKDHMLKVDDTDKINLFLDCIEDIITSES
ncbi:MAG: MBL fold metallo-hydrolase RNA specificity domain-containing protein [Anaerofustis sp.]